MCYIALVISRHSAPIIDTQLIRYVFGCTKRTSKVLSDDIVWAGAFRQFRGVTRLAEFHVVPQTPYASQSLAHSEAASPEATEPCADVQQYLKSPDNRKSLRALSSELSLAMDSPSWRPACRSWFLIFVIIVRLLPNSTSLNSFLGIINSHRPSLLNGSSFACPLNLLVLISSPESSILSHQNRFLMHHILKAL